MVTAIKKGRAARVTRDAGPISGDSKATIANEPAQSNGSAAAVEKAAILSGELIPIPVDHCERHPDNRRPTDERIERLAASLQAERQLEPIIVRRQKPGAGNLQYQIISGETRWRAAMKLGWRFLDGRVVECSDARALELLAIYNAAREDLNPIEKGRMIERLCQPVDKGGGGLTREAAAAIYGLESGGAASNLVRLLELPKVWQQRVSSGELPQTFARELLRCAKAPKLMEELNTSWERREKGGQWESRTDVEENVDQVIAAFTRPVDPKDEHRYRATQLNNDYSMSGEYPLLFELTDELREDLDIVELEVDGKKHQRATNCKVYDKHQIPAIKKHVAERREKDARKSAGGGKAKAKRPLSAAEQKHKDADLTRQLETRVKRWRHAWLKQLVAAQLMKSRGWRVAELAFWFLIHRGSYENLDRAQLLAKASGDLAFDELCGDEEAWMTMRKHLSRTGDDAGATEAANQVMLDFCVEALSADDRNPDWPFIPFEVLDGIASDLAIDLDDAWKAMQRDKDPRFTEFLELHQSGQLDVLAKPWSLFFPEGTPKGGKIRVITSAARILTRPASIAAVGGKVKRKKAAK